MNGLGLPTRHLTHALGGTSRGCQQQHIQSHAFKHRKDTSHRRGLTRTRATRQQQNTFLRRKLHRFTLGGRIGDSLLRFHLRENALHIFTAGCRSAQQQAQLFRHKSLRLKHFIKVARSDICHLPLNDLMSVHQRIQRRFQTVATHVDELCRCTDELLPRQEHMAVVLIMQQFKQQRTAQTFLRISGETHGKSDLITAGKIHTTVLRRQHIRVVLHTLQRRSAEAFVKLQSHRNRQFIPSQKLHQSPHAHALAEAL